jgi:hypothetical protein
VFSQKWAENQPGFLSFVKRSCFVNYLIDVNFNGEKELCPTDGAFGRIVLVDAYNLVPRLKCLTTDAFQQWQAFVIVQIKVNLPGNIFTGHACLSFQREGESLPSPLSISLVDLVVAHDDDHAALDSGLYGSLLQFLGDAADLFKPVAEANRPTIVVAPERAISHQAD